MFTVSSIISEEEVGKEVSKVVCRTSLIGFACENFLDDGPKKIIMIITTTSTFTKAHNFVFFFPSKFCSKVI